METVIEIDGRPVKFRATAAVPRLYRIKFRRDVLLDMQELQKAMSEAVKEGGGMPPRALEIFEDLAYIMAKHADPAGAPDTPEDWLDGFDTFSVYEVYPQLLELWGANLETRAEAKKKSTPAPGT